MPVVTQTPVLVVVDTREKLPYSFDKTRFVVSETALPAGDYSLVGHETTVAIERKTLSDFVSTVIHARERWHRELVKLRDYEHAAVVLEATPRDILTGMYGTGAHPHAVWGSAIAICVDWGVPVHFCQDRKCARQFTQSWLARVAKRLRKLEEETET